MSVESISTLPFYFIWHRDVSLLYTSYCTTLMVLCFSMATYNVWIFVFFIPEYSKIQFWYRAFYWNNTAIRIGLERTAFIFSNSSYICLTSKAVHYPIRLESPSLPHRHWDEQAVTILIVVWNRCLDGWHFASMISSKAGHTTDYWQRQQNLSNLH